MAKLDPTKAEGRFGFVAGQEWNTQFENESADLEKYTTISDNLPEGEVIGAVLTFPVADGQAFYRVVKERPLTLQHIPYGDAWTIPDAHIRGITKKDVLQHLSRTKKLNKIFGKYKK